MEFRLPELGEGVTEGELVKWLVKPGDAVKDDQPIAEIMTDKATIEIPSPFAGTIKEIHAKEGEIVKVHQLMLTVDAGGSAGASKAAPAAHAAPAVAAKAPAGASAAPVAKSAVPVPTTKVSVNSNGNTVAVSNPDALASPSTRRYARESGVDVGTVSGSGPHGRVLREDVERSAKGGGVTRGGYVTRAPSGPAGADERIPIRGMRKKIAEKMHQSKTTAAHFTYVEEADATELVKLRTQAKVIAEQQGIKLTYLPFILKAMVAALKKHPRINSTVDDAAQELVIHHTYNISISVQTEDGLTVPVIKDVERKGILQLAQEIADIVERARKKKLTLDDFHGSTITLTNAGSIGGLFATPIINYPEVAILGFNKIARKPVVKTINGREKMVIRDWTYFSISLDHRMIDGAEAAEFMKTFIGFIESPLSFVLEPLQF